MARYRNYDEDYQEYRRPRYTRQSNAPAWTMAMIMIVAVVIFVVWLAPDLLKVSSVLAPEGAVSNQAPPALMRRAPAAVPALVVPTAIPGLAGNEATAQAQYDQAVQQGEHGAATPVPLPLNSAGEPVIDAAQQQQMNLSLQLAEQEANAAADQLLQAQRATAYADADSRPPDVSYEDAKALLGGRDPCSVPRADPHTCAKGLYKPTPVQ